jgi:hypothetical protein
VCDNHDFSGNTISLSSSENRLLIVINSDEVQVHSGDVVQFIIPANNSIEKGSSIDLVLDHETLELLWNRNSGIGALRLFPAENWLLNVDALDSKCCSVKAFI